MEPNCNNLLKLISVTIHEQDSEQRGLKEKEIEKICSTLEGTNSIFNSLLNQNIDQSIKTYLFVLLRKYANSLHELTEENASLFIENMIKCLYSLNLNLETKKRLISVLKIGLSNPTFQSQRNSIRIVRDNTINFLKKQNLTLNNEDDLRNNFSTLILAYSLYTSSYSNPSFNGINNELSEWVNLFYKEIIQKIITILEGLEFTIKKIKESNKVKQVLFLYLEIVVLFSKLLKYIIKKIKNLGLGKLDNLSKNLEFFQKFQSLFFLKIGNITINNKNILFNCTEFSKINGKISVIKKKILFSLKIILKYFIKNKDNFEHKSKFIIHYKSIIRTTLESLNTFYTESNLEHEMLIEESDLKSLIFFSLKFLNLACCEFDFFELFSKFKKPLIVNVLVYNMILSENEKNNFEDNPDDFVNYTKDIIDYKKSKTIKVLSSKLISNLSDKIDGATIYLTYILLELSDFTLNKKDISSLNDYSLLSEIKNSYIFSKSSILNKFDTSLLVLSIISHDIFMRNDLKTKVKDFINFCGPLTNTFTPLLKCRFFYFVTSYIDAICDTENDIEKKNNIVLKEEFFKLLINELKNDDIVTAVAISNIESLIKNNENKVIFFEKFGVDLINTITNIVVNSLSINVLNLLYLFVTSTWELFNDHPDLIEKTIETITQKIIIEETNKKEEYGVRISKCWNIIITMSEKESLAINFHQPFYEKMKPVIIYAKCHFDLDWEDEVLDAYDNVYRFTKLLPPNHIEIFELILHVYETHDYKISNVIRILNTFLRYSSEIFNEEKVQLLFYMIEKSINCDNYAHAADYYVIDTILLLQIIIQQLGPIFLPNDIEKCLSLYNYLLEKITTPSDNIVEYKELFLEKVDGIYLSLLISCPNYIIKEPQVVYLNNIRRIIENSHCYETTYEKKLLCFGLISCLKTIYEKKPDNYLESCCYILNFLILYLKFFENLEIVKFVTKKGNDQNYTYTQKENNYFFIKDQIQKIIFNSEINDYWFDHFDTLKEIDNDEFDAEIPFEDITGAFIDKVQSSSREKQTFVKYIISSFDHRDEYKFLKRILSNFRKMNNDNFEKFISHLDIVTKNYFKDVIFRTNYVKTFDNKKEIRKIVKILKVK